MSNRENVYFLKKVKIFEKIERKEIHPLDIFRIDSIVAVPGFCGAAAGRAEMKFSNGSCFK